MFSRRVIFAMYADCKLIPHLLWKQEQNMLRPRDYKKRENKLKFIIWIAYMNFYYEFKKKQTNISFTF